MDTYTLHPCLLGYVTTIDGQRQWVLETSCSERPLLVSNWLVLWGLSVLPERFTRAEALSRWSNAPVADCGEALWSVLDGEGLLVPADSASYLGSDLGRRAALWQRYGWHEAFTYQEATRSYPFVQMNAPAGFREDRQRMRRYRDEGAPPPSCIDRAANRVTPLRDWSHATSEDAARCGSALDALALVLDYCAGGRAQLDLGDQGVVLLKSVPSGGARHPTEVYLVVFDETIGLAPGAYHYQVATHGLELVAEGDFAQRCCSATFDLFDKYDRPPRALFVFTLRVERAMWRYRDARSARAPFVDVGHVIMAFRTATEMAGFNSYTYQKFREDEVSDILSIDPLVEPPVYVGTFV